MLTADMERCILGGLSRGEFAATFSANPLLTSVIAEHITSISTCSDCGGSREYGKFPKNSCCRAYWKRRTDYESRNNFRYQPGFYQPFYPKRGETVELS
jgi:hypothetical protein